jgi:hypothetical protein
MGLPNQEASKLMTTRTQEQTDWNPLLKRGAFALLVAAYFAAMPYLETKTGYVTHALLVVALGVLIACAVSGTWSTTAIASGALGAFFHDAMRSDFAILAGAAFAAMVYVERTLQMPTRKRQALHTGLALAGGGLASAVIANYQTAAPSLLAVALAVGVALFCLPLIVDADDPMAQALERTAHLLPASPASALREAAHLKRGSETASISSASRETVQKALESILKLGETRAQITRTIGLSLGDEGSRSVAEVLDKKILSHVDVVKRAFAAADAVHAIVRNADTSAVDSLAATGESLDEVRKALSGTSGDDSDSGSAI